MVVVVGLVVVVVVDVVVVLGSGMLIVDSTAIVVVVAGLLSAAPLALPHPASATTMNAAIAEAFTIGIRVFTLLYRPEAHNG